MSSLSIPVLSQDGKELKKMQLNADVFDGSVNEGAIYQAVLMYRANKRMGLASTKTRKDVSGGGAKPWRQKGTGRARVGSSRNPLWVKGGVVFGPHPRDFSFTVPKKILSLALKSSLNAKLNENNFILLDKISLESAKTKQALKILSDLKTNKETVLILVDKLSEVIDHSFKNISFSKVQVASQTNAYDVLRSKRVIVDLNALHILEKRIKDKINKITKGKSSLKKE